MSYISKRLRLVQDGVCLAGELQHLSAVGIIRLAKIRFIPQPAYLVL
jgi:hypothetical protein